MDEIEIPKKTYVLVEQGVYPATITNIEKATGNFGPQLKFTFDLGDDCKLLGWTSATYSEKSKLYKWAQAIRGATFDPNATFKATWLLGQPILVEVSQKMSTDGSKFNRIENVLAMPKQKASKKPVPVQEPPEEGPDWTEPEIAAEVA